MSMLKMTTAIVTPIFLLATTPAWAGQVPIATNVPEPSMFGLVALGVIGVIAASRWRKK